MPQIRCPRCNGPLATRKRDGRLLLVRMPIVFRKSDDGGHACEATCPTCRADVSLPLQLADEKLAKSLHVVDAPPPTFPAVRLMLRPT